MTPVCVTATIPESVALSYETFNERRTYRHFMVPAAVIDVYGKMSRDRGLTA
jgi:hypothetical protein